MTSEKIDTINIVLGTLEGAFLLAGEWKYDSDSVVRVSYKGEKYRITHFPSDNSFLVERMEDGCLDSDDKTCRIESILEQNHRATWDKIRRSGQ